MSNAQFLELPESQVTGQPEPRTAAVVQTCSLRFADGKTAQAQIISSSPYQESAVRYAGHLNRLPALYPTANSVLLRAMFRSFARELLADFSEEQIGNWPDEGV
jgi:hypothetical protein